MVQQFHLDNLVVLVPLVAQVVLAAQVDQAHLVVPVVLEVLEELLDLGALMDQVAQVVLVVLAVRELQMVQVILEVWVDLVVPQAQEEPVAPVALGDQVDLEDQEG